MSWLPLESDVLKQHGKAVSYTFRNHDISWESVKELSNK